jgi:hypothetical protein
MSCRLGNTSWAAAFFLFFLFLGQHWQKNKQKNIFSKSAAHTVLTSFDAVSFDQRLTVS